MSELWPFFHFKILISKGESFTVSSSNDLHAEDIETLAIGDVVSANDNDMDENRMQSDDPKSRDN